MALDGKHLVQMVAEERERRWRQLGDDFGPFREEAVRHAQTQRRLAAMGAAAKAAGLTINQWRKAKRQQLGLSQRQFKAWLVENL